MSYGRPISVQGRTFSRQAHSPQIDIRAQPVIGPRTGGQKLEINFQVPRANDPKPISVGIAGRPPISLVQGPGPQITTQIPPRAASAAGTMNIQIRPPQPVVVQQSPAAAPPPSPQQQPQMSRFSLLSFVSSFEEGKSFNETDLASLGLDLQCDKPLLPMLHSVLSDAPLLDKSCLPVPECYTKIETAGEPKEKIGLFTEQTLMFIFATQTRTPLQAQAAEELQKRGYVFDGDSETWRMPNGNEWSVDEWREIETHTQQVAE